MATDKPTQLRVSRVCPDCAGTFNGIPRKPAHYKCPKCGVKWSWGQGFVKPEGDA